MSQQPYSFEYRKPRHSNPTFISNNISSTLSFYHSHASMNKMSKPQINSNRYPSIEVKPHPMNSRSDFSLPKINRNDPRESALGQEISVKRQQQNHLGQYGRSIVDSGRQEADFMLQNQNYQKRSASIGQLQQKNTKIFPSSSIERSLINFNQKDIFMKQGHNYNIITYQPKQHNQHIKKYPKLSLQQKDQYYRMRYIKDPKFTTGYQDTRNQVNPEQNRYQESNKYGSQKSKHCESQKMAGLHTYKMESNRNSMMPMVNMHQKIQIIEHGLDAPNTRIPPSKTRFNPRSNKFDMKLLSNMDELNYYA